MRLLDQSRAFSSRRFDLAGLTLGFGFGGFFDGILLHQVLQWHHLLSGLQDARHSIQLLVIADGLFHVLMYVIAILGVWLLFSARSSSRQEGSGRRLIANALVGFGLWHGVDAVLSHWILGIHRIRMDVQNPLLWDVLWLAIFGIVPLVAGLLFRRRQSGRGGGSSHAPALVVLVVAATGLLSAFPSPDDRTVMVLFRPGITASDAMAAIGEVDGRLIWSDPSQKVWAVDLPAGSDRSRLYRHGALLVSNSILPGGCFNWIKT